jgi:uncharacterized membrane protein YphA (DoxX/SURF4 family)
VSRPSIGKTAAYWGATGLVALFMLSGGVAHVLHLQASVDGFVALGYPLHFVTLLGIWKLLGALAILAPKLPRLKEWAHAGVFMVPGLHVSMHRELSGVRRSSTLRRNNSPSRACGPACARFSRASCHSPSGP